MKNAVISVVLIMVLLLTGFSLQNLHNKTLRSNELDKNLGSAVEDSMKVLGENKSYTIDKENEQHLVADFIENFLLSTTSNSTFEIRVLAIDAEKGLLDVEVTENFNQLGGIASSVTTRKTAVLEDYTIDTDIYYTVSFESDGKIIKQTSVNKNATLQYVQPENPYKKGYDFIGWQLNGEGRKYTNTSSLVCMGDMLFVANFEKSNV